MYTHMYVYKYVYIYICICVCTCIYALDAQMGAKAPIWLDVRTVASAPNESR